MTDNAVTLMAAVAKPIALTQAEEAIAALEARVAVLTQLREDLYSEIHFTRPARPAARDGNFLRVEYEKVLAELEELSVQIRAQQSVAASERAAWAAGIAEATKGRKLQLLTNMRMALTQLEAAIEEHTVVQARLAELGAPSPRAPRLSTGALREFLKQHFDRSEGYVQGRVSH